MNVDKIRKFHLSMAEALDAWRVIPRLLVSLYCYLLYEVITWYMELKPYILEGCTSQTVKDCIIMVPTSQHAALVTAVVGVAAAVFGFYASTGRKWNNFTQWNSTEEHQNKDSFT